MKKNLLVYLSLSFAFVLAGCSFTLAQDITPPPGYQSPVLEQTTQESPHGQLFPIVAPDPQNGEAIYAEKCAPCHGALGLGDGPQAADLPNDVVPLGRPEVMRQAIPLEWYIIIGEGNIERFMPPFKSLSERERWDVMAYAMRLAMDTQALEEGKELYDQYCSACHGKSGAGDGPEAGEVPATVLDLTDQRAMTALSGVDIFNAITEGVPPAMPGYAGELDDDQRWAIADYVRTLSFASSEISIAAATVTSEPTTEITPGVEPTAAVEITATQVVTQPLGMVRGDISNASGGDLPADLEVTLHGFDHIQPVLTDTVKIDSSGVYTFTDVEMPAGRIFLATVDFENVTYGSEIVTIQPGESQVDLPIEIFESTQDSSQVYVDRLHFFFEFLDENTLRVVELYVISNSGQKTLVGSGEDNITLRFSLPEGASNLDFDENQNGERFVTFENGFGDTRPVRPGMSSHQILISYEMPYDRKLALARKMDLPVRAVVILIPVDSIKVKGENITDAGVRDIQGVQFRMFNGISLDEGEELNLTISGKMSSGGFSISDSSSTNLLVGLAALGVVLIAAGVWLYRRNAVQTADEEDDLAGEEDLELISEDPDTIMDAILALDDLYQEGQLPDEAYQARREELKSRLREVLG